MNEYKITLDVEPESKYQKVWKALVEADAAIRALTPQEQQRLAKDYCTAKGMSLLDIMQHYCK